MMPIETCPICLQKRRLTNHHLWRRAVYGRTARNNEIEKICEVCHQVLETEITRKENQILRQHPEIYAGTFNSFLAIGEKGIEEYRKKLGLRKRRRR